MTPKDEQDENLKRVAERLTWAKTRETRLNRSRHWKHADTYEQARADSAYSDRPVR